MWAAALPAIAAVVLIGVMTGVGGGGPPIVGAMMSTKPVLTSLTVSAGTLSPSFSGTEVEYTVQDVPYGTRVLTINAVPETGGTVTFWHRPPGKSLEVLRDKDEEAAGHQLSLGIGQKTVIIEVGVGSGSQYRYREYEMEITRLKPTVSIRAVGEGPVYEGDTLEFEIRRSAAAADSLAVRVLRKEVEAEVGAGHADLLSHDVDGTSPEEFIEGGDATAIIEVETNGDTVWESHSKVQLSIKADDLYDIDASAGVASIVVQDDEFLASTGVLTVSPNPVGEGSDKTTATITVTTTGDKRPHGEASVAVETSDGTATAGSDYTGVDASVKFTEADFSSVTVDENARYRASKTVEVTITQDMADEDDETFSISASTETGSPIRFGEDDSTASVTITDDDEPPTPAPTLTSLSVDAGTLTPAFSSDTLSYTIPDVGYENDRLTITANAESGTSIAFFDSSNNALADLDDMVTGHQVSLGIGVTVVKVRATKGNASQDYSLSITRAKPTVSVRALTTTPAIEGHSIEFQVTRSAAAGDALAVKFTLDEVGASAGVDPGDVLADSQEDTTQSVTVAADGTTATIEVTTTSDSTWENHSKIEIEIVDDDSYTVHATEGSATVLVRDDEFVDSVATLSVAPNPVGEGDGKTVATVTVTTDGDKKPHGRVTVPVSTTNGTAIAGSDFTALDASLAFAEGDFSGVQVDGNSRFRASKSVDVVILQDTLDDEDENFTVALGTPSDALVTLDEDSKSTAITITDDELPILTALSVSSGTLTPPFSSSQSSYTVPDVGYGNHQLTITATAEIGASVSHLDSSNDALEDVDDTTAGQQVSLDIGGTTVKVRVSENGLAQDYTLVITRTKPTVSVQALTTDPATEGDKIKFEVARSESAGDALAVKFTLDEVGASAGVDPGDVLADSQEDTTQSVTIAAGETTAMVEVTTTLDSVWEEHSKIELGIVVDDSYTILSTEGSASVLVRDDEFVESVATLSMAPNPVGEGVGKTVATVTVTTDGDKKPHGRITIPVSTTNGTAIAGSDFTALDASLTFAEGDFSGVRVDGNSRFRASKSVDVVILQDALDDEDETFSVALGTPSGSLLTLDADAKTATVTITDDELPILTALSVSHGTLTPTFSSTRLSYSVPDVGYGNHLATINVTPESGAEVSFLDSSDNDYDDLDDMAEGHQVYLNIGSTTIKIRVEEDGAEQDYVLVFTRAKPTVSIQAVTVGPATEGDALKFEVSRSEAAGDVLEVRVGMDEVDVVEGEGHGNILPDDIEGMSPLRTIEIDQTSVVFTVDTTADGIWEKHSSIEMTIKAESRYEIESDKGTASVVVRDDEFVESVATLSVAPNPVGEGAGKVIGTVTVTTDDARTPHGMVSIPISTADGTATAGEDYSAVDSTLVFEEGDFEEVEVEEDGDTLYRASKSVEIPILTDDLDEDAEAFSVALGAASLSVVDIDPENGNVSVTIKDQNSSPVVTISTTPSTPVVLGRGTISLDGTSSDSDDDTLTFSWATDPANLGTFDNSASEDSMWTAPAPISEEQTVTLTLTVTDDGVPVGATTADVEVTVRANQAPTVKITTKGGVVKGDETVMLEAGVSDPEAGALTYKWSGGGSFKDDSAKDITWTAPSAKAKVQEFTLTLTATDELGLTASDSVEITVPASNRAPVFPGLRNNERNVNEGAIEGAKVGAPVTATDPDGNTLTYALEGVDAASFDINAKGQITVSAGTTLDYEVKPVYEVSVTVSDGLNEAGEIDQAVDSTLPITIHIGDVEEDGVVTFSPQALRVGDEVRANVRDPDNYESSNTTGSVDDADVTSWVWERSDNADGPWAQVSGATAATYVPRAEDEGKYLRVIASYTDRRSPGNEADKEADGVSGRVGARGNSPPVVHVSPDMAIINGCSTVTLSSRSSDPDGDTLSFYWTALPGVGQFGDGSKESTVWSAPDSGQSTLTVVLTLTVSDGQGGTATDSVIVTVSGGAAGAGAGG